MRCPYCGKDDTRVIDSRPVEDNNSIRRRRICDSCSRRFTTYEKIETIPMMVTKKDNNREAYDRSKIEGGILRACHKRPVSAAQIKKIVDEIEDLQQADRRARYVQDQQARSGRLCQVCLCLQGIQGRGDVHGGTSQSSQRGRLIRCIWSKIELFVEK